MSSVITSLENFEKDAFRWLQSAANEQQMEYALLFCYDGVMWGRREDGQLRLSRVVARQITNPASLDTSILIEARLFGPHGEIRVRRNQDGAFEAYHISDAEHAQDKKLEDEAYWLWGTPGSGAVCDGVFTLLAEGRQGLFHAPPVTGLAAGQSVAVIVRHYVKHDEDTGQAYIAASRLVKIEPVR